MTTTTAGIATGRAAHVQAQRNLALAAYDELLRAITTYQRAGALGSEVAVELHRMAGEELAKRLADLETFEGRESRSRLVRAQHPAHQTTRQALSGGVEP